MCWARVEPTELTTPRDTLEIGVTDGYGGVVQVVSCE
jgi:hypothetical protein